jgi:adenylate cyclase
MELVELEAATREPPVPGMAHTGFVELASSLGDAQLAREHASELLRIAEANEAPYVRVFAEGYAGLAAALDGEHEQALRNYRNARALIGNSGAAREFEPELLAWFADSCLELGDWQGAYTCATEAIELSRERTTRIAECRGLIVRGAASRLLGRSGAQEDLASAQALIALTGAIVLRPALDRARSIGVARPA